MRYVQICYHVHQMKNICLKDSFEIVPNLRYASLITASSLSEATSGAAQ